jgi:hypothetical protein
MGKSDGVINTNASSKIMSRMVELNQSILSNKGLEADIRGRLEAINPEIKNLQDSLILQALSDGNVGGITNEKVDVSMKDQLRDKVASRDRLKNQLEGCIAKTEQLLNQYTSLVTQSVADPLANRAQGQGENVSLGVLLDQDIDGPTLPDKEGSAVLLHSDIDFDKPPETEQPSVLVDPDIVFVTTDEKGEKAVLMQYADPLDRNTTDEKVEPAVLMQHADSVDHNTMPKLNTTSRYRREVQAARTAGVNPEQEAEVTLSNQTPK